jgi:transposase
MHDSETRAAALRLAKSGHSMRAIARALQISRGSVSEILTGGTAAVPTIEREERLLPELDEIRRLYGLCGGNLVRVQEMLQAGGVEVPYSTVTAFCRRHGVGVTPPRPVGRYEFAPGEEMQHDTSPHTVVVGGARRTLQCVSLVLAYSRRLWARCYPTYDRFHAKAFLTEALVRWGGCAGRAVIDNTSVVLAHGTGPNAVPAPEMSAFAERFGFDWFACNLDDPDRKARVERPFHYIENNFYPGRQFADLADLNTQLAAWCDRVDRKQKRRLGASPLELFAVEQPLLKPLPIHVPEVYVDHPRTVDLEGYVHLHTNAYSVPIALIGREVAVRETLSEVRVVHRYDVVATHARVDGRGQRRTDPAHREGWRRATRKEPTPEESALRAASPELAALVDRLKAHHGGRAVRMVRRLHRMFVEYPTEPLVTGVRAALEYGLLDLERIERVVLRQIERDFFRRPEEDRDG